MIDGRAYPRQLPDVTVNAEPETALGGGHRQGQNLESWGPVGSTSRQNESMAAASAARAVVNPDHGRDGSHERGGDRPPPESHDALYEHQVGIACPSPS